MPPFVLTPHASESDIHGRGNRRDASSAESGSPWMLAQQLFLFSRVFKTTKKRKNKHFLEG